MLDYDVIETPENVELQRPLAGIGSRFIAGLVDKLLLAGIYLLLFLLAALIGVAGIAFEEGITRFLSTLVSAVLILVFFAIYWGYYVFFELLLNGQSPGKRWTKIRVVKEGGGPVTFTDVAIRNLLRAVDCQPVFLYGVAGVVMFVTRRIQRLGDMAAGTVVVSEQVRDYSARSDKRVSAQWEGQISAEALRATGLQTREYSVLYNYWSRRDQITGDARQRVLPQLLRPILQRTRHVLADQTLEGMESYVRTLMQEARSAELKERQNSAQGEVQA